MGLSSSSSPGVDVTISCTVQLMYGNDRVHKRRPNADDHHSRTVLRSCADFQRPSSTNKNVFRKRRQNTLNFQQALLFFGYIKQKMESFVVAVQYSTDTSHH
mmetsp:Transcript_15562/g.29201  ORF Transcript_15562/g.29201 Transcript_15562/m.29201 type:complete len:102 (+) Transcript_15562:533-838(+)